MKPNDKAYQAAILAIKENGPYYAGSKIRESMAKHLADVALPAAYAAQFQSEDYAGLLRELRMRPHRRGNETDAQSVERRQGEREKAADALETLLAKLNNEPKPSEDYAELIARLRLRAGIFKDTTDDRATADALEALLAERDALLARLAPVEDEELEAKVAAAIIAVEHNGIDGELIPAAISAIRPHIEAAEREKIAETVKNWGDEPHFQLLAAAIRSGK